MRRNLQGHSAFEDAVPMAVEPSNTRISYHDLDATIQSSINTSIDTPHNSKDLAFWLVFCSLCISSFLSALDLVRR